MPDIDFQRIVLNLIPKQGEQPVVFYASQYETKRSFIADLMWGDTEFAPGDDHWAEIDIRKNDDNLVVITDDVTIDNNEVSVMLPVQAVTCIGKNLGQIKIYAGEDQFVAAFNFILEVQPDPLAGGVTSETAIDNLTQQIEDIAEEVIGEDYYNKTETDALLADKADKSELPDMTNYYTKTQTDNLLNDKADRTDLATLASKAEVTQAISDEDTAVKNWVSSNFATPGYVATHYYTKLQVDALIDDIFPTFTASGTIATFTTALNKPFVSVTADPNATTITRCGVNLWDEQWEVGGFDANGAPNLRNDVFRTKNYIQVPPNTVLHIHQGNLSDSDWCYPVFYDINKNPITRDVGYGTITMPANAYYLRVQFNTAMGNTYANNISINYPSTDTSYHAYNGQTVPVADAETLTTLSGVNNVYADVGDVTVQYKYMSM